MTASLRIDLGDPTPPYEQLRRQLVGFVANGDLAPGERLPPVRQLAGDLGLAPGTVARAYRELEEAGLVEARTGRGTRVRAELPRPASTRADDAAGDLLTRAVNALVAVARTQGRSREEVFAELDRAWVQGRD